MKHVSKMAMAAAGAFIGASTSWADTLPTHRIPAALAAEAASETVAACARQGYHETAVVLDADGATIAVLRGDGAGIHRLDSAHVSFKNDTLALAERAKDEDSGTSHCAVRLHLKRKPSISGLGRSLLLACAQDFLGQWNLKELRLAGSHRSLSLWPCRGGGTCQEIRFSTVVSNAGLLGEVISKVALTR
jgi:hypothetical protein